VAKAARQFPVGEVGEIAQVYSKGIPTSCFRVVSGSGTFALHLFARGPQKRIESVLSMQARLANGGVPCPRPLPSRAGAYSALSPGGIAGVVEWVEGPLLAESCHSTPECIGRIAAQLHSVSGSVPGPEPTIPPIRIFLSKIRNSTRVCDKCGRESLCSWIEGVLETIPPPGIGHCGLIHNDIHHRNIVVPPAGTPHLIDFANCEHNLLVKDIGVALFYVLQVAEEGSSSEISRLLNSYLGIRRLAETAISDAVHCLRLKALEFTAWQLLRHARHEVRGSAVTSARDLAARIEKIVEGPPSNAPFAPVPEGVK
jgi:homoserine kinase type II